MLCPLCQTLEQIRAGGFARHVMSLDHCEVILHDNQVCPGWCVLIAKNHAEHAAELSPEVERAMFAEAARVGRALRVVFPTSGAMVAGRGTPVRINYANLGNVVGHIHWHVVPRHVTPIHIGGEGIAPDPDPRAVPWNLAMVAADASVVAELRARLADAIRATSKATAKPGESTPLGRSDGAMTPRATDVHTLIPMAHVADVEASLAFYGHLGFAPVNVLRDAHAAMRWAMLRSGDAAIMLARASGPIDAEQQAVLLYMYTHNVAALREALLNAGIADVTAGAHTQARGPKIFPITHPDYMPAGEMRLIDPDGYVILVGQLPG
jgi:diadenosine tetraphosphate (Ap4A) HIT family hydrolase